MHHNYTTAAAVGARLDVAVDESQIEWQLSSYINCDTCISFINKCRNSVCCNVGNPPYRSTINIGSRLTAEGRFIFYTNCIIIINF